MYLKINIIITLFISVLISLKSSAQKASIVFNSEHNFSVTINQIKQHNIYHNHINIKKITGDHPYNIIINFDNDTTIVQSNIYLIDNRLTHIYTVTKNTIQLKKIIPTTTYKKKEDEFVINYTVNTNLPINPIEVSR